MKTYSKIKQYQYLSKKNKTMNFKNIRYAVSIIIISWTLFTCFLYSTFDVIGADRVIQANTFLSKEAPLIPFITLGNFIQIIILLGATVTIFFRNESKTRINAVEIINTNKTIKENKEARDTELLLMRRNNDDTVNTFKELITTLRETTDHQMKACKENCANTNNEIHQRQNRNEDAIGNFQKKVDKQFSQDLSEISHVKDMIVNIKMNEK